MRVFGLVVALLVVMSCKPSAPPPPPQAPPRQEGVGPAASPVETPPEITIDEVTVANPLVVTGHARTFENNVVLRVRDGSGKLVRETFTTSHGEMGRHNPFRGEIWLTRDPGARITVEALEYSAKDGSERSLTRAGKPFDVELLTVRLRLPNHDCTGLVESTRRIPKSMAMARLLVEAVMEHPVFPKGSAVRSVNLRDGVLTVDFNERLQNVGGSCAVGMIRSSLTETLTTLPSVKRVVITAAGSESLALQP